MLYLSRAIVLNALHKTKVGMALLNLKTETIIAQGTRCVLSTRIF